jgi:Integrase core domain.
MDTIQMSPKEITRLEAMQRVKEKRMSQVEAARQLRLSERQVQRLWRAYREDGAGGLVSKQRGKPSNHQLEAGVKQRALDQIQRQYSDFGPTLAQEKLTEKHELKISVESVRQLMIAEELWKPKRARKAKVHPMRERRACYGELVQVDGSEHAWFEERGPRCTLLVMIDDATGQLGALLFVSHESFFGYGAAMRLYLAAHGRPGTLYSDKHGIFHVNIPSAGLETNLTQFGRAMQELEIQIICANTAQAKGRVERVNETLQDRLPKELRLRNISNPADGNAFLPEFIDDFNSRFPVPPRSTFNFHRPLSLTSDLERIFSWQESRKLSNNLTLQYKNVVFQIQTKRPAYSLRKTPVKICENSQGVISLFHNDQPLLYTIFNRQERQAQVVPAKSISFELRNLNNARVPASTHPWHTYGMHLDGTPIQHDISTLEK